MRIADVGKTPRDPGCHKPKPEAPARPNLRGRLKGAAARRIHALRMGMLEQGWYEANPELREPEQEELGL